MIKSPTKRRTATFCVLATARNRRLRGWGPSVPSQKRQSFHTLQLFKLKYDTIAELDRSSCVCVVCWLKAKHGWSLVMAMVGHDSRHFCKSMGEALGLKAKLKLKHGTDPLFLMYLTILSGGLVVPLNFQSSSATEGKAIITACLTYPCKASNNFVPAESTVSIN